MCVILARRTARYTPRDQDPLDQIDGLCNHRVGMGHWALSWQSWIHGEDVDWTVYALGGCLVCKGRRQISKVVGARRNISFSSILSIDRASSLNANRLHRDGDDPRSHKLASGVQESSSEPYSEHRPCCMVSVVRLAEGLEESSLEPTLHSFLAKIRGPVISQAHHRCHSVDLLYS